MMNRKLIFSILFLICGSVGLYTLALRYPVSIALSQKQALLSPTTKSLLKTLSQSVNIELYSTQKDKFHETELLIEQYQKESKQIHFAWKQTPYSLSDEYKGEALVIHYDQQTYIIDLNKDPINEATVSQILFKCIRRANHWIVFLQGHGEPDLFGKKGKDYELWRTALENQGFKIQPLTLTNQPVLADNVELIVIASPKSEWLPHEEALITQAISQGKDVLWLMDPQSKRLHFLEKLLGVSPLPGIIVDLHGQKLGTPHPAITLIEQYPLLPFSSPSLLTAYPWSVALEIHHAQWEAAPLLLTHEQTWTETSDITGQIGFEPEKNEKAGPLILGARLSRNLPHLNQEQRIAVIGNARFVSNGVIQNYGNLAFSQNLISWLNHDEALLKLEQPVSNDSFSHIHLTTAYIIQFGFPFLALFLMLFVILYSFRRARFINR